MAEKRNRRGLIAFANSGGLAIQTRRLYQMLKPSKVLIIDSRGYSKNKDFHPEWYPKDSLVTEGFPPKNYEILEFIDGLKYVFVVENPYNFYLIHACRERGIKVFVQTNYEFCENVFAPHLPVPDLFLMPSHWKVEEMKSMFGDDRVIYLPPPIDPKEFSVGDISNNPPHFLHIVGTLAFNDRNGTLDLLEAVKLSKKDYKLTIHSQHKLPKEYIIDDPRVIYRIKNFENNADLYTGFDALILPRRYGGLSLTTNEALMSGMPVIMTDVSPNNKLLPKDWLIPVSDNKPFLARALIDCYFVSPEILADAIDNLVDSPKSKDEALSIAMNNFDMNLLYPRYMALL